MKKNILITGATDGIGHLCAQQLVASGHDVLIHGRSSDKLQTVQAELAGFNTNSMVTTCCADLSDLHQVNDMCQRVIQSQTHIDALINNAGVLKASRTQTAAGLDIRYTVNTIAPYLLTRQLLSKFTEGSRVINVASAAQDVVSGENIESYKTQSDMEAYSKSKLAIIMWSRHLARKLAGEPIFISVNPGSLLGTKMVREGFGIDGKNVSIGADILQRAATDESFADANGLYFDSDSGQFADPHPHALNDSACAQIVSSMDNILAQQGVSSA